MGVKRAVETAEKALDANSSDSKKIFTLGPLIHNPLVLDDLRKRGVQILGDDLSAVDSDSVVIIRAHGTTVETKDALSSRNAVVMDATCPRVLLSQKRAAEWASKGYCIIIAGDRNHGEVVSISSCAKNKAVVIENVKDAEALNVEPKTVLIAQTTFSPTEFEKIVEVIKNKNENVQVFNSICSATMERQESLRELEGQVDGILVIGGKSSANTKRLYETASAICPTAALIENADEIPSEFFKMEKVGITAGASTPDFIIDQVEQKLSSI